MKLKLIIISLFMPFILCVSKADEGETLFNNKQFARAKAFYEGQLKKRPTDVQLNFRYARCCYELKDYDTALKHFLLSGTKNPQRDQYLGDCYYFTYRFDESVLSFQNQLSALKPGVSPDPLLQQKLRRAELGAKLLAKVDDIAIVDSQLVNKSDFLRFYKISSELGTLSQEALKIPGKKTNDKIRYTTQRQDRVYYSDSINGQMDIFTSYKLLDTWSEPVPVSEVINTRANENYPFLLLDGITLYFASDGENSLGGYDIFVTRFTPSTNSYLQPENVGFPFNSIANDYMMAIDEQHNRGWFATDRNQQNGKVMIYTFVPNAVKNIVRSEDKDELRRAALLKTFRIAQPDSTSNAESLREGKAGIKNQIEFVINDSLIYTSVDQFRSEEAKKLLTDMLRLTTDNKAATDELAVLRSKYADSSSEPDRKAMGQTILDLENKCVELKRRLSEVIIQIRNEENKFLAGLKAR